MKQKNTTPTEKRKRAFSKKQWLHYLVVYLACLLAACLAWLLVRYTMRTEENVNNSLQHDDAVAAMAADNPETDVCYG